jgi:hypothetical protein
MRSILSSKALVLGVLAGVTGAVAVLAACSSNSGSSGSGQNNNNNNGEGGTTQSQLCPNPTLSVVFSPMYSAYIPNSNHTFQIPAIVDGIDNSTVTWAASDTSIVSLAADMDTGGTMINVNNSGTVQIIATSSMGGCGVSTLNITPAQESDWDLGNARYNNGVPLIFQCVGRAPGSNYPEMDGGTGTCPDAGPACTNCHGPTANAMRGFNDIAHTPEQTGGFSDTDLGNIITNGTVPGWPAGGPDAGYYDPNIIPYNAWHSFHNWSDIQGDTVKGMVVYLRSLTPTSQDGSANFGGHYDGGHHHHDGGFGEGGSPPPNDSGSSNDSATQAD